MSTWAFSNGTDHLYWEARNCDRCRKTYDPDTNASQCELNNGIVADEAAARLGWTNDDGRHGDCPELEPK